MFKRFDFYVISCLQFKKRYFLKRKMYRRLQFHNNLSRYSNSCKLETLEKLLTPQLSTEDLSNISIYLINLYCVPFCMFFNCSKSRQKKRHKKANVYLMFQAQLKQIKQENLYRIKIQCSKCATPKTTPTTTNM